MPMLQVRVQTFYGYGHRCAIVMGTGVLAYGYGCVTDTGTGVDPKRMGAGMLQVQVWACCVLCILVAVLRAQIKQCVPYTT